MLTNPSIDIPAEYQTTIIAGFFIKLICTPRIYINAQHFGTTTEPKFAVLQRARICEHTSTFALPNYQTAKPPRICYCVASDLFAMKRCFRYQEFRWYQR